MKNKAFPFVITCVLPFFCLAQPVEVSVKAHLFSVRSASPGSGEWYSVPQTISLQAPGDLSSFQSASARKKPGLAVLYSLLLPGMGEWYAGYFESGRYSLIAEGGLWLTYAAFQQYGGWLQRDGRTFAAVHAGASNGMSDQFYTDIGNFSDINQYNEKKLRDRENEKLYPTDEGYAWRWDSESNRQRYRGMRISSDQVLYNSRFVIAAVIINHVVSAVNAARLVRRHNSLPDDTLGSWRLESSLAGGQGIRLTILHSF